MLRVALLLLLLPACGRTDQNGAPSSAAGAGGTASNASGAGGLGAGGVAEQNCLFPRRGLEIAPTSDKPPIRYALTPAYPVDVLPAQSEFAAAYEVNGDAVSDLLLLDWQATPPRFRLLLTSSPPDVLDFVENDCEPLRQLPAGRLLLRDLNGDGVQDFVVGTTDGVQAFLNRAEGLLPVLEYHMAPTDRASLINLGMADLNGDEQSDLVVSFDRVISEATWNFELRAQAFLQQDGAFAPGEAVVTTFDNEMPVAPGPVYTGYLAAGRFRPDEQDSALLLGSTSFSSSFRFGFQTSFEGLEPVQLRSGYSQHTHQVFAVPRPDAHTLVLTVADTAFFLLDLSSPAGEPPGVAVPSIVAEGNLTFNSGLSHELGGGYENPRYFVYDIDRDGDLDFLERDPEGGRLALHINFANSSFDAPQVLEVDVWGGAEAPFVQVGPSGAVVGHPKPGQPDSAVYVLVSQDP